jgi:hypothetical protein
MISGMTCPRPNPEYAKFFQFLDCPRSLAGLNPCRLGRLLHRKDFAGVPSQRPDKAYRHAAAEQRFQVAVELHVPYIGHMYD